MFVDISEYIKKPQSERQNHLDLTEHCLEIGGDSREYRALLAHYLKTTIPKGWAVQCCHACSNAKCSNPKHLYWGTSKENNADAIAKGTHTSVLLIKRSRNRGSFTDTNRLGRMNRGKVWVNDGSVEKRFLNGKAIPENFVRGRLPKNVKFAPVAQ